MAASNNRSYEEVQKSIEESNAAIVSFDKPEDVRKLAQHFQTVINHPITQQHPTIVRYLEMIDNNHRRIYTSGKQYEGEEVEYIYCAMAKRSQQRQRFSSVSLSDVSQLLASEFPGTTDTTTIHVCAQCEVTMEVNGDEPLEEALKRHFALHQPEPVLLPNMSRRKSAMERGEAPTTSTADQARQLLSVNESLDPSFQEKLEASLNKYLTHNPEVTVNAAIKYYHDIYHHLGAETAKIDLNSLIHTVSPILMSIKDNVNQNFATDTNRNYENEETDAGEGFARTPQVRVTRRYYGPIEIAINQLLTDHKILLLPDDRTAKPAFFCMVCEFYTLRFRYDSVLNHVFSELHVHNLAAILNSDLSIPFASDRSISYIKNMNKKYLVSHSIMEESASYLCQLCDTTMETIDKTLLHALDEGHLANLSDKLYRKAKVGPDTVVPKEWGLKSIDWSRYLTTSKKIFSIRDYVIIENFIKPCAGKVANYCLCCDLVMKGPRQIVFNHIRQKKHLKNAAPYKLSMLFRNQCRALEYYASAGNFYMCSVCVEAEPVPSFARIVEHFQSADHVDNIAKLVAHAHAHASPTDETLLEQYHVRADGDAFRCTLCELDLESRAAAVSHVLGNLQHQTAFTEKKYSENKGDIISVYMKGNYILFNESGVFNCVVCKGVFGSLRALLMHLIYTEHFEEKPDVEDIFRFYLELKHNINLLTRNKFSYPEFGKLHCGVCQVVVEGAENAKRHVGQLQHRDSMHGIVPMAADVNQDAPQSATAQGVTVDAGQETSQEASPGASQMVNRDPGGNNRD